MAGDLLAYLSALQFADSAFPSGRYTLSQGLEPIAQSRLLAGGNVPTTLQHLLAENLRLSVGPADGAAVVCAHSSYQDLTSVTAVERRLTAVKLTVESRHASLRTGKALLGTAHTFVADPVLDEYAAMVRAGSAPGHHAVVVGLLGASVGLSALESVAGELYAFTASWSSAALRLGLIDHRSAQQILYDSRGVVAEAAEHAVRRAAAHGASAVASYTPAMDLMSMRHEVAEIRLFAN
jgi:urease accessory protein